jgi:tubulin polyglutamylase TTLL6/13
VKPAASSQGKGIFMISEAEEVNCLGDAIVQEYIDQPLLIDGLKFDMRIYVLVSGCDPLRIFIHKEGLARFATEKYFKPAAWNLDKVCMHLTNYSLNKSNPKFIKNKSANDDNQGHKRSLSSTLTYLEQKGFDVKQMWKQVSDMVVKTIASIQPSLAHTYRTCRPADVTNAMCFEILGFDVILDKNFQPWLLEVNHSPSFETSTPLDKKIKTQVIVDCLKLLGLAPHDKKNFESRNKMMIAQRSIFRKSFYEKNQDLAIEKEIFEYEREVIEGSVCGLVRVYPKRLEYYKKVIDCAKEIVEEFTGARKRPQTTGRTSTTPQPARGKSLEKSPYRRLAVDGKVVNKDCSLKKKVKTKKI